MKLKRKISIRKILQVFITVVTTVCCIVVMVSASRIEDSKTVSSVAIHINNGKKYHFIEQKEIMDLAINNRNVDVAHTPLSRLDIHSMEQVIMADPWVANAQVFIDNDRVLHMYVTQRVPVARIFEQSSKSYYIDATLSTMPLSSDYVYYTLVVTNVPELKNDSASQVIKKQVVSLVRTIQADTFWNAQISQVIVDSSGNFELIPVLGNQRILFGDISRMKDKFDNLFAFYKNVLNRIGWDKYQTLDLRFKGQVVASPALPYKGPVDKAVANMNWINSIVETEARNDSKDSVQAVDAKEDKKPVADKHEDKPKEKPKEKPVAKADTKKKEPVKADKKKDADKGKKEDAAKEKDTNKNKEKDKKQASPKYQYPGDKGH